MKRPNIEPALIIFSIAILTPLLIAMTLLVMFSIIFGRLVIEGAFIERLPFSLDNSFASLEESLACLILSVLTGGYIYAAFLGFPYYWQQVREWFESARLILIPLDSVEIFVRQNSRLVFWVVLTANAYFLLGFIVKGLGLLFA